MLDAYCCQGGAGIGYFLAGFEVLGIDKDPQP
ncbi:SAM-dependent methyltransferase, partial [Micromonospora arborensis]